MTARVALPLPLDAPFSYAVPDAFEGDVTPGVRVVVPLGPRVVTGVVVEVDADDDGERLKRGLQERVGEARVWKRTKRIH